MTKRSALGSDRPGFESQLGNLLPVSLKPGFIVIKVGTVTERLAGPRALLFLKKVAQPLSWVLARGACSTDGGLIANRSTLTTSTNEQDRRKMVFVLVEPRKGETALWGSGGKKKKK